MSELKWSWVYYPYLDPPEKQKESALRAGYNKVYLKAEADKVIAELEEKLKNSRNTRKYWRNEYLIEYKECHHSKYKRCLAMASTCRLRARWFGDNAFYKKEQWALKWHKRWLELAENFKENK